jgi:hypothetical protein
VGRVGSHDDNHYDPPRATNSSLHGGRSQASFA